MQKGDNKVSKIMSSPKSPELSDKSKKYDRQIRLWGEHGQNLLENSNVCLINATALGCEVLKGVVLPGIGGFTIVDSSIVTDEDVGSNFFLETSFVGLPKAQCCTQLLKELNPDVNGDFIDESIDNILQNRPNFLDNFNVVIASSLTEKTLVNLSRKLWELNKPFFYCRSIGFFGSIRLQIKEHCVIEAHPDNRQHDLRLENPFPSLKQHLETTSLTSKVPWVVVLYKYFKIWSREHENRIPDLYKEKLELREMIRNGMTAEEENYEEAIKAVNSAFGAGRISLNIQEIFNDDACVNLNNKSQPFWIIARALKDFIRDNNNGYLPLPGILPDMTADTESYINLQNVYRQQSMQDSDNVYRRCQEIVKELGISNDIISEKTVRLYCREAAGISIVRGSQIADEYEKTNRFSAIVQGLETPGSLMEHYVALRSFDKFQTEYGYIPGDCNVESDTARLKIVTSKLLNEWGCHNSLSDDLIHELCRYGGAEIHSVSAFIGGCASHEVVKMITEQYKPIDNTFVFNAISTETGTFKL